MRSPRRSGPPSAPCSACSSTGDAGRSEQILLATIGGVVALVSHLTKAGLRLAVNTSPEPASNIAASTGEDLAVAGLTSLAVVSPWIAFGVTAGLLVLGGVLALVMARTIKRGYRRWREPPAAHVRHPVSCS